jgi:hypothetical protein
MDKIQFNAWAQRHGLTIDEAAIVLGMSRANAFKYANGTRPVALYVEYAAEAIDLLSKKESLKLIQKRLAKSLKETNI